jgi:predicted Zn-dependent protease with MMP-like domain
LSVLAIARCLPYLAVMNPRQTLAPSLADIEVLAQAAVERLPDLFRNHLATVLLRIEDFPDAEVMAEMGLESEWDILGLYQGRHVGMKGDEPTGAMPDMIFLYRRPMLDEWSQSDDSLEAIVTHVLVHEVGHHFGLSDAAMEAIEAASA